MLLILIVDEEERCVINSEFLGNAPIEKPVSFAVKSLHIGSFLLS